MASAFSFNDVTIFYSEKMLMNNVTLTISDGDRIGVIDEKGQDVWSDIVLALLAKQLLEKKPGAKVIYDVKCSKALTDVIEANGGIPVMWKTGHSYIKSKMHEMNAELAGERSGHIFMGGEDWYGFDDAIFVAAPLMEVLVSFVPSAPSQRFPAINSRCPSFWETR